MSLTFSEEIYGLRCLTPLPTIFQLYHGGQFYMWRKLEYPEGKKTNYVTQNILVFNIDINHCGNYLYMFITKKTELQRNV
jgi:hypothetical protein